VINFLPTMPVLPEWQRQPPIRTMTVLAHRCTGCMVNFWHNTNERIDANEGETEVCPHTAPRRPVIIELHVNPTYKVPEASLRLYFEEFTL
jgi:hypothetical protein